MNVLYTTKLEDIRKDVKGFYNLAKEINGELTSEQFRATLEDGTRLNWPYSGAVYCKKCGNDVLRPYFYPEDITINPALFDADGVPKHNCEPLVRDKESGELRNSTGMPVAHQHITVDPIIP